MHKLCAIFTMIKNFSGVNFQHPQCLTKHVEPCKEIRWNWKKVENFNICFYAIFDHCYQHLIFLKEDTRLCFHRVFRFSLSFSDFSWFWLLSPLVSTDATHIQCFYTRYCVAPWLVENCTYTYMLQSSKMPYTQLQFLQIVQ